jgi:hypothetical protein
MLSQGGGGGKGKGAESAPASIASNALRSTIDDIAIALRQAAARAAQKAGPGSGPVHGTRIHTLFKEEVQGLGNPNLGAEASFVGRRVAAYGTRGSIRIDAVLFDNSGRVIAAFELKTGSSALTTKRIQQIQAQFEYLPVIEIRP